MATDDLVARLRRGSPYKDASAVGMQEIDEAATDRLMDEAADRITLLERSLQAKEDGLRVRDNRIEALEAQLAAVTESAKANMQKKHKERAEVKLWFGKAQEWFGKAQEWKAQLARTNALIRDIAALPPGGEVWDRSKQLADFTLRARAIEAGATRND